ncbi:hypothetical protein [Geobacter anodireducens]
MARYAVFLMDAAAPLSHRHAAFARLAAVALNADRLKGMGARWSQERNQERKDRKRERDSGS